MSDELKHKLDHYEVTPPDQVWNNITSALSDQQEYLPVSNKMYHFEVIPPESCWTVIANQLTLTNPTPAKTIRTVFTRLAAAAIFLGVIITGSIFFFQRQASQAENSQGSEAQLKPAKIFKNSGTSARASISDVVKPPKPGILYAENNYAENEMYKRVSVNVSRPVTKRSLRNTDINNNISEKPSFISVKARPIRNESGQIIQDPQVIRNDGEQYISITGPNGQQTRISAKFMNALMYLNGEADHGDATYYESEEWQRKFQDWRNKIMQTSYIPSSTNFLDILEFKDLILKDNQQ